MVVDNFLQLNIITEIAQEVAFDKLEKNQDDRKTNQSSNEKHILHNYQKNIKFQNINDTMVK